MTNEPSRDWTPAEGNNSWAPTDDPRVVAVIQRDGYASIAELFDGDAINPIIYVDHVGGLTFTHQAGYDGGEAELMQRAYEEWGWNATARRYLWIFHGIAAANAFGGYDRSGNWIVATSHSYNDHIGNDHVATYDEALESLKSTADELAKALDGEVYGIGYAVNESRVLDDTEIEFDDGGWEISIECWGFVGEEYAQREAADLPLPPLPTLLTLEMTA